MAKKKYIFGFIAALLLMAGCGDSLEDTYSQWTDGGPTLYLGKCTDLKIQPGWHSLHLTWVNSTDSDIEAVRVMYSDGTNTHSLPDLPAGTTQCDIPDLGDKSYEVMVYAVANGGVRLSNALRNYARPYTANHEEVISFGTGVARHFFVDNNLVLFFGTYNENLTATIKYETTAGEAKTVEITPGVAFTGGLLIKNVNPSSVWLERTGRITGIKEKEGDEEEDTVIVYAEIPFEDIHLTKTVEFSTPFQTAITRRYGNVDLSAGSPWLTNLEELELDYSLPSFEEILNFPNLKKVILGKNRYLNLTYQGSTAAAKEYVDAYMRTSKISDLYISAFALDVMNQLKGTKFDQYNEHYINAVNYKESDAALAAVLAGLSSTDPVYTAAYKKRQYMWGCDYSDSRGRMKFWTRYANTLNPVPALNNLNPYKDDGTLKWNIYNSAEDGSYNTNIAALLDNDWETYWQSQLTSTSHTNVITIDMQELQTVKGFKVVQRKYYSTVDATTKDLLPEVIQIKVSADGAAYANALDVTDITIGNTGGETTILTMPASKQIRYIRITVYDRLQGTNFASTLADFIPFN